MRRLWTWLLGAVLYAFNRSGREQRRWWDALSDDERDKLRREQQKDRPGVPPPAREREVGAESGGVSAVAAGLLVASAGGAGFVVFYVVKPDTQLLGLCLGVGFVALGIAAAVAGKRLFPREVAVERRHEFGDAEQREEIEGILDEGFEGVTRRKLLGLAGGAAGLTLGAAMLMPVASLGPNAGARLRSTSWYRGRRLVDEEGRPFRPGDIPIGAFRTGFPEGGDFSELDAPLVLVRLPLEEIKVPDERKRFMPDGVMAYSKICPHAGCAVSMYRHPLYEPTEARPALVCPCHYSTFDISRGGHLEFGPAGRDLPSLPLALNAAGELIAAAEFSERIGPSWGGVRKGPSDQPLDRGEG